MAKVSAVNKNDKRIKLSNKLFKKKTSVEKDCYGQKDLSRRKI